jgi:hypothetical protein
MDFYLDSKMKAIFLDPTVTASQDRGQAPRTEIAYTSPPGEAAYLTSLVQAPAPRQPLVGRAGRLFTDAEAFNKRVKLRRICKRNSRFRRQNGRTNRDSTRAGGKI